MAALALTACSNSQEALAQDDDGPTNGEFQIQYTTPVPSEFFQAASQQGTIELLEYDSKDYTSSSRPATRKPAYVYLPYGYDPTQKYDVIYLLHGFRYVIVAAVLLHRTAAIDEQHPLPLRLFCNVGYWFIAHQQPRVVS